MGALLNSDGTFTVPRITRAQIDQALGCNLLQRRAEDGTTHIHTVPTDPDVSDFLEAIRRTLDQVRQDHLTYWSEERMRERERAWNAMTDRERIAAYRWFTQNQWW